MWHCFDWVREALLVQLSVLQPLISLIDMCPDRRSRYAGANSVQPLPLTMAWCLTRPFTCYVFALSRMSSIEL